MKTIICHTIVASICFAFHMQFSVTGQKSEYALQQEQQRVEVSLEDLPEKVKASVGHNTELAWTILKAYLVTNPDRTTFYDLYVQKPDGETWMKVDKEGKVLN
jgi:hypothetical protein